MNNKIKLVALLISVMFLVTITFAATETVITRAWWTVPSVVDFQVFLPGEAGVISDSGISATTTDINFSSAVGGNSKYANATVVGGSAQTDSTPIFTIYNTGDLTLNTSLIVNTTLPSGVTLYSGRVFTEMTGAHFHVNSTENWIINGTFLPYSSADWNQSVWLWSNFTSVSAGMYIRNITIAGNDY